MRTFLVPCLVLLVTAFPQALFLFLCPLKTLRLSWDLVDEIMAECGIMIKMEANKALWEKVGGK